MMPSRAGWAGGTRLMYYKVRKNQKATNRPYSGLWPLIIGKSVNPKCQRQEDNKISSNETKEPRYQIDRTESTLISSLSMGLSFLMALVMGT